MKKYLIFLIIPLIILGVWVLLGDFGAKEIKAGAGDNVSGWAWSENIGWISFNNTTGGGAINYGVNIDPRNGKFSGYAWSENIGWISFNEADTGAPPSDDPCGDTSCIAKATPPGNLGKKNVPVYGWARALNYGDGWDGWIRFDHGQSDEVYIAPNGEFHGWAWGSDVVGWISFNCVEGGDCGTSDYKVIYSPANQPPSAINLSATQGNYCFCPSPPIFLSWQFSDPDPGDSQSAYQVQVDNNSNFSSPEIDSGKVSSGSTEYAPANLSYNTTYYWRVKVWDSHDAASAWATGFSFTTALHAYPWPDFTHSPQTPNAKQEVNFTDTSICYDAANTPYSCKDNIYNRYQWDFEDDGIIDCDSNLNPTCRGDTTWSYPSAGDYTVRLYITDDLGTCHGTGDTPIGTRLPLPWWKEIIPF